MEQIIGVYISASYFGLCR